MGDEKNDELNLKDKDHDRDNKFINKIYDENNFDEYKTDILIRTRHALRNISVLNILIRSKLIKEHEIRSSRQISSLLRRSFLTKNLV